jgi:nucleotide-binding universal stress UspA family protein
MYKHILASLDGSSISTVAAREAVRLAKEQNAILRLLYVVDPSSNPDFREYDLHGFAYPDSIYVSARQIGEKILWEAQALARREGVQAETVMLDMDNRNVADVIVDEAARWPADLIVVGTHGRSGVGRLVLGSVAEGVIRKSAVPVLTVRG